LALTIGILDIGNGMFTLTLTFTFSCLHSSPFDLFDGFGFGIAPSASVRLLR